MSIKVEIFPSTGADGLFGFPCWVHDVKVTAFSGGEIQVRLPDEEDVLLAGAARITANINSARMLMAVFLTADALRRRYLGAEIHLVCPYLPYARQDRVCYPGEALSLKVACDLINAQNFASVEVWDVHSDVGLALLDRVSHRPAYCFTDGLITDNMVVVAPDRGAVKRATACATGAAVALVLADKTRDPKDGSITGTVVHSEHIGSRDFLMVDDIADGGRTFIELAKVLRPLTDGKVLLYVTHGIFSQDFHIFRGLIDHIYTPNLFEPHCRAKRLPDIVTVI
jgi:ribose-phosphate pyrophosphokinase